MKVNQIDFPKEIATRLNDKIKQTIKIEYFNGNKVDIDKFNLSILQPHKILFKKEGRFIIVYITENISVKNTKYNFFVNSICDNSKHSLNNIINLVNKNMG